MFYINNFIKNNYIDSFDQNNHFEFCILYHFNALTGYTVFHVYMQMHVKFTIKLNE